MWTLQLLMERCRIQTKSSYKIIYVVTAFCTMFIERV